MTKKLIAAFAALTVLFVCCFTACSKGTYKNPANDKAYRLVTDENGDKVLSDDGELLVYATDDAGKQVTEEGGEPVTVEQGFIGQIVEDNVIEDFGYIVTLPDGWKYQEGGNLQTIYKTTDNKSELTVTVLTDRTYEQYYTDNKALFSQMTEAGIKNTWNEKAIPNAGTDGVVCTMLNKGEEGGDPYIAVMAFFENNGNLYKIILNTSDVDSAEAKMDTFLNAITYKPYRYSGTVQTQSGVTMTAPPETTQLPLPETTAAATEAPETTAEVAG